LAEGSEIMSLALRTVTGRRWQVVRGAAHFHLSLRGGRMAKWCWVSL